MSAIGLRVGPFEICDEVAVPGADSWYRAQRTGLTRRQPASVLVRLLGPSPTSRELAAAQRQFDVLRSLDDRRFPTAVALYEGSGALAVDAVVGTPLTRVVEARLLGDVPMTPATVLDLALDLTEAMAHAHGKGVHHGHLSAECATMDPAGRLVVWGMGDTQARPPFPWLSPEVARSEQTTAQTDQWSLGALIVSLVTGRTPWSPSSAATDPRTGQIEDFVAPLARQWPALGRLTRRMLDPNPQLRFPSLHPVRLELLGLARRAGGTSDRRALGVWLDNRQAATPAQPEPERPLASPTLAPPTLAPPTVDEPPANEAPPQRRAAIPTPDDDVTPRIDQAARGGIRLRPRVVGPHASEAFRVVAPEGFDFDPVDPSEFDPSVLPTEMATEMETEMMEDDDPMVTVPPVRPYQPAPVPTRPEMEVPEPSAPKPLVAVAVELEEDEDDLMVEDPLIEITASSIQIPLGPPASPKPPVAVATLPAAVAVQVELDADDLEFLDEPATAPEPLAGVVAFTNPDFGGPSLGLDRPVEPNARALSPAPQQAKAMSIKPVQPEATSVFPDLGLDEVKTSVSPTWPWENHQPQEPVPPSDDPVVKVAPWLASGVVAALALLLVVNVLV